MQQIIGIVGPMSSGKSEVAKVLAERGFYITSLSDRIREECTRRGILINRQNLQNVGDYMRNMYGDDVLGILSLTEISQKESVVVESIRHPEEIRLFRGGGMIVIGVDASRANRFKYMQARGREGDPKTYEEFLMRDFREYNQNVAHAINIPACMEMANIIIQNNSTKTDLRMEIYDALEMIGIEGNSRLKESKY